MDGQKTILDLASACLQQGQSKKDVSWWTMVCSALRKQGLLFGSTQEHRDDSNEIVNKTDIYGIHFEITNRLYFTSFPEKKE